MKLHFPSASHFATSRLTASADLLLPTARQYFCTACTVVHIRFVKQSFSTSISTAPSELLDAVFASGAGRTVELLLPVFKLTHHFCHLFFDVSIHFPSFLLCRCVPDMARLYSTLPPQLDQRKKRSAKHDPTTILPCDTQLDLRQSEACPACRSVDDVL